MSRTRTPIHAPDTSPESPGAAQFISNLTPRQLQHLQFTIPSSTAPDRFSQFLEEPRETPVPKRFTFEALDAATRKQNKSTREGSKLAKHARDGSGSSTDGSEGRESKRGRGRARSRAGTTSSRSSRPSIDLLKEVGRVKTTVEEVDWRFYGTGGCICMINLVAAWDATALSVALPTIATALHGSALESLWLGISFLVAATAFLPLFSVFSDIFGRKAMLLTGLTFFTVGAFIAAVSGNFGGLHLGRSVQGIGAGGFVLLSDLIVSDLNSVVDRRKWSTALGGVWAIGAVTGPVIGESLAERSQWRWIFWLNLPFCVVAFLILPFFAQLKSSTPGAILPKLRNIDWVGFLLLSGSLVSVLLGISWGGTLHAWSNFNTLLPLQFGVIGLILFCVWSWYSPFPSMISLDGFLDRTSLATYFGTFIQGMIICAFLYFMPFYFGVAKPNLNDAPSGARWFPWTLPLVIFIIITFLVVSRWNCWLPAVWLGWFVVVLGVALTSLFSRTSPNAQWISIAILLGSGVGILYPSLHTVHELIVAQVQDGKARRAVTNFMFFQLLGKTFGVAITTSIFQNELLKHLLKNPTFEKFAMQYTKDAVALVIRVRATPGGEGSPRTQIADAYVGSLRVIWIVTAVMAGMAMFVSYFMKPKESKITREVEMKNLQEGYVV